MKSVSQLDTATASASNGRLRTETRACPEGAATEDPTGRSYNEDMFRYFLTLERKRFNRSGRPFLLLLVELRKRSDAVAHFKPEVAEQLFGALGETLRETDFVGWYREGRIAGALLTQPMEGGALNVSETVRDRVGDALCEQLPPQVASRIRLRVYQLPVGVNEPRELWP
jgi:hypothetical protein